MPYGLAEYTYVSEDYSAFYPADGGVMDLLYVGTLLLISESHYLQPDVNYNIPRFTIIPLIRTAPYRVLT
jgi:hypothetical protein